MPGQGSPIGAGRSNLASAMSLPEIPESEAAGRIAGIYRAILDATGLPSTNLVWRHMASYPGVLEWAYDALEEAFSAGAFRALGADIAASMPPVPMPPLADDDGLDRTTLEAAAPVMAFYNRANPINLVALFALRRVLAGEVSGSGFASPPPREAPLPRLPPVAGEVDDATQALMASLAGMLAGPDSALMPTALRHLANWPATIPALHRRVAGLVASGALDAGADALSRAAGQAAARVSLVAPGSADPAEETRRAIEGAIELFLAPISRMAVVGRGFESVIREALAK